VKKNVVGAADVRTHERLGKLAVAHFQRAQYLPVLLVGLPAPLRHGAGSLAIDAQQVVQVAAQRLGDAIVAACTRDALVEQTTLTWPFAVTTCSGGEVKGQSARCV